MALNGSEWVDNPWNTTFSPFTDMFETIFGNGLVFFLIPLIVLAFGIYMKTDDPVYASMFIMASGGIFALGTFLGGLPELGMIFTIFMGIGITIIVTSVVLQKRM